MVGVTHSRSAGRVGGGQGGSEEGALEQEEAEEEEEKEDEAVTFLIGCLVLPDEYFQCSAGFDNGYLHIRPSIVVFRARISDSHCSVLVLPEVYRIMVFWEMTSGICFGVLFLCLVRQRILFLRLSTEW